MPISMPGTSHALRIFTVRLGRGAQPGLVRESRLGLGEVDGSVVSSSGTPMGYDAMPLGTCDPPMFDLTLAAWAPDHIFC